MPPLNTIQKIFITQGLVLQDKKFWSLTQIYSYGFENSNKD
jgi:hypothetical protein